MLLTPDSRSPYRFQICMAFLAPHPWEFDVMIYSNRQCDFTSRVSCFNFARATLFDIHTPPAEDFLLRYLIGCIGFKWNSPLDVSTQNVYTLCYMEEHRVSTIPGLLKYDLCRDMPVRLEQQNHFYIKVCRKMRLIFIPEPQI